MLLSERDLAGLSETFGRRLFRQILSRLLAAGRGLQTVIDHGFAGGSVTNC